MPTQYVKVNEKSFPCVKSETTGNNVVITIPTTEDYGEVKTAFVENTGDIQILYDHTVMQVYTGYNTFVSIYDNNVDYVVTVALTFNDAEALEIITGGEHPTVAEAESIRASVEGMATYIPDEEAEQDTWAFPAWVAQHDYVVGNRIQYGGLLYKVIQDHTSQADWTPDVTPALYARISDPGEEWPEWIQPTGSQDAYSMGDKVSHNEKHWISNANANVWEPGVYGWDEAA